MNGQEPHRRATRHRFLVGTLGAGGAASAMRRAKAAQFEFKCGGNNPADSPASTRVVEMWDAVQRESGGRIRTQFYPNGQLGTQSAIFSQLRIGAIEFLHTNPGAIADLVPVIGICFLGFAYTQVDEVNRAMLGPLGNYIRVEVAAKDIQMLRAVWDNGMYQIGSSSHPIATVDDMQGFKIRTVETKIQVDLFKTLGASPTPVSLNELYTALQTKLVDGEALTLMSIVSGKFYELNKYISATNHSWAGECMIANASVWKRLPSDLQAIIERNNTKYAALESNDMKKGYAADLTRRGMVFNQVDQGPFRLRLRPYFEYWSKEFGPAAWALLQTSIGRKLL